MKIGKILKSNRERLGIDISEIVEKQEFKSIHYINSVENDIIKTPLDVLMIYCEVLNISPNEILGWKHNRRLGSFEKDIQGIKKMWKENPYFESNDKNIRQMTIIECERLQTLPDGYTDNANVSDAMRYECIGNGWTVDVIAHIFKGLKEQTE